jgi:predicted naringenin-chalcone synthase
MKPAKILALHTDTPSPCYTQSEIAEMFVASLNVPDERRGKAIRRVMEKSGVAFRHIVAGPEFYSEPRSTQQRNDRYMAEALPLGEQVIRRGLTASGLTAQDVDGLVIVSCTGFNTPGLDLLLARDLSMPHNLNRTSVIGMGCYGAFPGIRRAWESVSADVTQRAMVLSMELCSLHLQIDDSADSVVSTSLFADGAGMVVLGSPDSPGSYPTLIDAETYCDYQTLDHMTFDVTDNGFRMTLSSYVPDVLKANVGGFAERLLSRNGLDVADVKHWAIHPGSQRIVEYIQAELGLADAQVRPSLDTLREYGNMSSATVLFVLERIIRDNAPKPGDYGVMMAFGPGLTMESILLRW